MLDTQVRVYNLRSGIRHREHVSPSADRVPRSPARDDVISDNVNLHEQLPDLKKKIVSSTVRCEQLHVSHHLCFLKDCKLRI